MTQVRMGRVEEEEMLQEGGGGEGAEGEGEEGEAGKTHPQD